MHQPNEPAPFHALIDTGALVTGMSNLEVAQYLLENGLVGIDGVVFLDEMDRKMICVRKGYRYLGTRPFQSQGAPAARRSISLSVIQTWRGQVTPFPDN